MWLHNAVVMVLVAAQSVRGAREPACPRQTPLAGVCECGERRYERSDLYVVNCSAAAFQSERALAALAELPLNIEVLVFTGNTVPTLPENVFGDTDLPGLSVVDLSDNRIGDISGKAFHHAPNVWRLVLDHNDLQADVLRPRLLSGFARLRELHLTDAFVDRSEDVPRALHDMFLGSGLVHLEKLHLEQNELRSLGSDERVLCGLPALMDLHLADNELHAVPMLDPHCSPTLRYLDLRRNSISRLSAADAARLDALARVRPLMLDLAANPLECAHAASILALPHQTNVTLRDVDALHCRHRFVNGSERVLRLVDAVAASAATSEGVDGLVVALITLCALTALAAALFLYRLRRRRTRFPTFAGIVSGSVTYTSIEPEDV